MTPDFIIFLVVFHSTTAFSATILNVLVIVTIWKTPPLQTPSRLLICSLASTDLLVGAVLQPLAIVFHSSALIKSWDVRRIAYFLVTRLGYGLVAVSIVNLLAIAVDRFLAIKTKQNYKSIMTKKRTLVVIVLIWTVPGGLTALLRGLSFEFKDNRDDGRTKIIVAVIVFFLLAITVFYFLCFYHLKKLSSQVGNIAIQRPNNQPALNFNVWKYKRSLLTMVMVLGLVLLTFLPTVILFSLSKRSELDDNPMMHTCESFLLLNSTLNPILYFYRMRDLRQSVTNITCWS